MAPQREGRTPAERSGLQPAAAPAPATRETDRAQQDKAEAERRAAELAARREQALKSLKATQAQKEQTQTQIGRMPHHPAGAERDNSGLPLSQLASRHPMGRLGLLSCNTDFAQGQNTIAIAVYRCSAELQGTAPHRRIP